MILIRIAILAARAVSFKAERITLSSDSASCVAALQHTGASLNPFFANRVAEIQHTRTELSKLAGEVEKFTHVTGKLNLADLGTRPGIRMDKLGPGKLWQGGRVPALVNPDLKPFLNLHVNLHADPSCALPIGARCSDDLAAAHYRLAHAVPMVGLWPTTEPNHIFYWNYNRLKARSRYLAPLNYYYQREPIVCTLY